MTCQLIKICFQGTPFGKLPIFEADGVVLAESQAISRYLAKKHGKNVVIQQLHTYS